jgi:quercetin dioxygenase-like cupin family protein
MSEQDFSAVTRTIEMTAELSPVVAAERIEVRRIRMPAGVAAGLHVHNGPVVGNIVSGKVAYQIEGQDVRTLGPGDVFFEPQGARIARFDALDEDVTFLAYFPLVAGQNSEMELLAE